MPNAKRGDRRGTGADGRMIDALIFISQRPIVITLALMGAALVIAGSLTARASVPEDKAAMSDQRSLLSRGLTSSGYVVTFASILLFIIAGFVSDLRP